MELKNKIVNFLGDSITQGVGTSGPDFVFPHLVEYRLGLLRANNYGISGTRIARQQGKSAPESFDLDYCLRCTEMEKGAAVNFIFGGTNDYGHGDAPIGRFSDRTPETFCGACHYLMKTLIDTYPGTVNVIATPIHRNGENNLREGRPPEDTLPLKGYVDIIRETAEYYALPVLDLWSMSGMQPELESVRAYCVPDGLHPNDTGHRILADRICGFLTAL